MPDDLIGVNCIMTVVNWVWVRGDIGLSGRGSWRKSVEGYGVKLFFLEME